MIIGGVAIIVVGLVFLFLRASLMSGKKAIGTIKKVENGIDYKNKKGKSVIIEVQEGDKTFSLIPIEDFTVSSELSSLPKKKKLPYLEDIDKIKVAYSNKENPSICTIIKRKDSIYIGCTLIVIGAIGIIIELVKTGAFAF
jgi:ribosomal protein L36